MEGVAGNHRSPEFWRPEIVIDRRGDGDIVVSQAEPLGSYPLRLSDRIRYWATTAPDRPWMAERDAHGEWREMAYGTLLDHMRRVGSFVRALDLSTERPLLILSGNSLEHAVIALSAQYAGVPSAAITPAYSLTDPTFTKLRDVAAQITPGAVFVQDFDRFAPAIEAVFDPSIPVIAVDGGTRRTTRARHLWRAVSETRADEDVDKANARTGPETIAKFLFTSGTTGAPKGVIQTQQMLCSNMEMVRDCFRFVDSEPPVLVDWAPWNHVASGNMVFNFALYNGGTYYIDAGKPTAQGLDETVRNLKAVSPTWYFNVPLGFDLLCDAMESDTALAASFFRNLRMIMYAGAGMAAHTWDRLNALSERTIGTRVLMCTGLGATETAPFALFCTDRQDGPGNVGVPMRGVTIKLVPTGPKLDLRIKGPNVTPGYWRDADLTATAFDSEDFYCMGDALRPADPSDLTKGFLFDGRTAENFKLDTGTWVSVGTLRSRLVDTLAGLARDAAICGENRAEIGALIVPSREKAEQLIDGGAGLSDEELYTHPQVLDVFERKLAELGREASGSSNHIARAMLVVSPLDARVGEITDKGSLNQKALLANRPELEARLFSGGDGVLFARNTRQKEHGTCK